MGPTKELIDSIYREKVLRARELSPEARMLEGPRLFEMACRITMDGIRAQNPGATEDHVLQILRDRLALRDRLERGR